MGQQIWYVLPIQLSVNISLLRYKGDLVYARLFHKPAIVINSLRVAQDLLEKRSANYSDRPYFHLLEE